MNSNLFLSVLIACCCPAYNIQISNSLYYSNLTTFPRFKNIEPRKQTLKVTRDARKISFSTDQDELVVGIDFDIPLLKVPSEFVSNAAMKSTFRGLLDSPSGPWSGLIAQVGVSLFEYFTKIGQKSHKRPKRTQESAYISSISEAMDLMNLIPKLPKDFQTHKSKASGVIGMQRIICNFVQQTEKDFFTGKAVGMQKIVKGLISSDISYLFFNGTALQAAINAGRDYADCEKVYKISL